MVDELLRPNWHVALIHFPLGLLVTGVLIELFSFGLGHKSFRAAGRWMIFLGSLAMIPASVSGMYAFAEVMRTSNPAGEYAIWAETLEQSPLAGEPHLALQRHAWLQGAATVLCLLGSVLWAGLSDRGRRLFHIPALALILLGLGFMIAGAWFGGEAIYAHGVGVQLNGAEAADISPGTAPFSSRLAWYLPPLQTHLALAGLAFAVSLGALAVCMRALALSIPSPTAARDEIEAMLSSMDDQPAAAVALPTVRFWLLAFVLVLLSGLSGWWFLAYDADTWEPRALPEMAFESDRRFYHVIAGAALLGVPLILAVAARWAPRSRATLSIFAVILIVLMAVQTWLGALLVFDTPDGSWREFNPPAELVETSAP